MLGQRQFPGLHGIMNALHSASDSAYSAARISGASFFVIHNVVE